VNDDYISLCTEKTNTVELLRVIIEFSSIKFWGFEKRNGWSPIYHIFSEKKIKKANNGKSYDR